MFGNVNMICAVNLYVNMESILLGIKSHAQRLHKTKLNCILSIVCSRVVHIYMQVHSPYHVYASEHWNQCNF